MTNLMDINRGGGSGPDSTGIGTTASKTRLHLKPVGSISTRRARASF